ncbi:MAG: TonB-dependent receptor plug domain-containing protein [Gemmatimonadetes bacterium]|nr:TonB-dependent receptor plug domain-containing protein [Gemmatimonadota bacterium]
MKATRMALAVVTGLMMTACASTGGADENGSSSSRNVITAEQLENMSNQSVYDVVRKLKPTWLQRRGHVSFRGNTELLVILDDSQFHDFSLLTSMTAANVEEIRYMDPRKATNKYGIRASGGAILLTTRS